MLLSYAGLHHDGLSRDGSVTSRAFNGPRAAPPVRTALGLDLEDSRGSFRQLIQAIIEEHGRELEAASRGCVAVAEGGNGAASGAAMHSLVRALIRQHERELRAACVKPATKGALELHKIPTEQRELLIEERTNTSDLGNRAASELKREVHEAEAKLLGMLDELRTSSSYFNEVDVKRRVRSHLRLIETGATQLAGLRKEHIQHIEQTRVSRVGKWCLISHADVSTKIGDMERSMGLVNNSSDEVYDIVRRLRDSKEKLDADLIQGRHRVQQLVAETCQLEAKLGRFNVQEDVWSATDDRCKDTLDVPLQLWQATFELQILAWRQSHGRAKQLCILEDRWKLFRLYIMLRRQEEVERAACSGDCAAMDALCAKLTLSAQQLREAAATVKRRVVDLQKQAASMQQLAGGVQPLRGAESDSMGDHLLSLGFSELVEDLRLAWLRKEQVQAAELSGLLRTALADAMNRDSTLVPHSDLRRQLK